MSKIDEITLEGMSFEIYAVTGEVMDTRKWTSTHVTGSGGGGGGYVQGGTGYIQSSSTSIQSTTQTHDQLFVKGPNGKELCVETTDADIQVRPGHTVSVVWGIKKGRESGRYWAIHNHDTDQTTWFDLLPSFRPWFFKAGLWWTIGVILVIGGIGGISSSRRGGDSGELTLCVGLLIVGWAIWMHRRIRARRKQFSNHFSSNLLQTLTAEAKSAEHRGLTS